MKKHYAFEYEFSLKCTILQCNQQLSPCLTNGDFDEFLSEKINLKTKKQKQKQKSKNQWILPHFLPVLNNGPGK